MSVFKCKICGGTLEISLDQTTAVCEYCGTQQTLPRLDDERRSNLYDRANHFRRNNEFDKASAIYEQILSEDTSDAEAYWSLVLCRYGVEYVEDAATRKRVPTVNRAQFTSVFDDDNYRSALQHADAAQRMLYEQEAAQLNEIQKGILAISHKEAPFDVFICYKETDEGGRRTPDSVLANDLYHQLTNEGFKVFFSRITLEDKLGTEYEPYIFAALNSASVMVVLGTRPEYFNAVWVKNEWARYLALIRGGAKKTLIPAYRDMDPYDLPEAFSHLQAQDMSRLGFMQDLIRGIQKIISANDAPAAAPAAVTNASAQSGTAASLLRRAQLFLEDEDWEEASSYFDRVLDIEPENAEAYLGLCMVNLGCSERESLQAHREDLYTNGNLQKALRFARGDLSTELTKLYSDTIYEDVKPLLDSLSEGDFEEAETLLSRIGGWRDADEIRSSLVSRRKENIYQAAIQCWQNGDDSQAIKWFESIPDWKDANDRLSELYYEKAQGMLQRGYFDEAEALLKSIPNAVGAAELLSQLPAKKEAMREQIEAYDETLECFKRMREGTSAQRNYPLIEERFLELGDFRDSAQQAQQAREAYIVAQYLAGKNALDRIRRTTHIYEEKTAYKDAIRYFEQIGDYKDSAYLLDSARRSLKSLKRERRKRQWNVINQILWVLIIVVLILCMIACVKACF